MAAKPKVVIVGAGNLGSALARALHAGGYRISEIICREGGSKQRARRLAAQVRSRAVALPQAKFAAEVVWICVPDSNIAACARELARLADWQGKIALHPSGALASDELQALRRRGASVASAHPLMTFVRRSSPALAGVPFGIEGDAVAARLARRLVRDLGGQSFSVCRQDKALYHAWGAFASPLLIALLASAEQVARAAGVRSRATARKRMLPILQQTLRNYGALGPADAFSGPLVRGDVATVQRHLRALGKLPAAKQAYVALARAALETLPVGNRRQLETALRSKRVPTIARR
ncbi:MAG TPA: Rossmann-like and DUF2520 domain-containing protein [Terriglobales bacterium]|nr:Rossmann-like and DUF2520 domain-containing protein [Terriglobales bacterium]